MIWKELKSGERTVLDHVFWASGISRDALAAALAPGGRLLYCTCSVFKAEGQDQVDAFLQRHPEARSLAVPGVTGHLLPLPDNPVEAAGATSSPAAGSGDGLTAPPSNASFFRMFAARLYPASRFAPSSVARKASSASTRRTMRTKSSSPSSNTASTRS